MSIHTVIDDSIRVPLRGKWAGVRNDLQAGKTVFVPEPDDTQARNALHQTFRANVVYRLHRMKTTIEGVPGTAFWLDRLPTR